MVVSFRGERQEVHTECVRGGGEGDSGEGRARKVVEETCTYLGISTFRPIGCVTIEAKIKQF